MRAAFNDGISSVCREDANDPVKFDVLRRLPIELAVLIGRLLSPADLYTATQVNRYWRALFNHDGYGFSKHSEVIIRKLPSDSGEFRSSRTGAKLDFPLPEWKKHYLRYHRIESNWCQSRFRYLEVEVDGAPVTWFRLHEGLAAICTANNSLHIASLTENKILADMDDFHQFSGEIPVFSGFDSTGTHFIFAVRNFIKVCGLDGDWERCLTVEIMERNDFVRSIPVLSESFIAFGSRRLTVYNIEAQHIAYQSKPCENHITSVNLAAGDHVVFTQGTSITVIDGNKGTMARNISTKHIGSITTAIMDDEKRLLISAAKSVMIHDIFNGNLVREIIVNDENLENVDIGKYSIQKLDYHGGKLLVCDRLGSIKVFDARTCVCLRTFDHHDFINGRFAGDNLVIAENGKNDIVLLDLRSGKEVQQFVRRLSHLSNEIMVVQDSRLGYVDDDGEAFVLDFNAELP